MAARIEIVPTCEPDATAQKTKIAADTLAIDLQRLNTVGRPVDAG
jgi:hypothetical protein